MAADAIVSARRSLRLRGYDYRRAGAHFVTICTYRRECSLGVCLEDQIVASQAGKNVQTCWDEIATHFDGVALDAFVMMPNHIHGIIVLSDSVGARSPRPPRGGPGAGTAPLRRPSLGQVVAYFKYRSAKKINASRGAPGASVWQRNYYDHIIRNENELARAREYIRDNPLKWSLDRDNPINRTR